MSEQSLGESAHKNTDEQSLGENTPAENETDDLTDLIEDATEDTTEEDFDFAKFVEGVRPTRRAVVLYQRNDLRANIDLLEEKIKVMRHAGQDVTAQEELLEEAAEELLDSGKRVIVEARGTDWLRAFVKEQKANGIDPNAKKFQRNTKNITDEQQERLADAQGREVRRLLHARIAAQIVHPKTGISPEAIERLGQNSEMELNKLFAATEDANNKAGVSPDFLQRHSGTRRPG